MPNRYEQAVEIAAAWNGESQKPKWEPVDWADLREGDEVRLFAFDMQEGWQPETRTVLGHTGDVINDAIQMHCPAYYSNTGKAFDYLYRPADDRHLAERKPERLTESGKAGPDAC